MAVNQPESQGLVLISMEGMQAMYMDGELVHQAPILSIESVLEELGVSFVSHFLSNSCNPVVRRGVFPIDINNVILEDDKYEFKGIK